MIVQEKTEELDQLFFFFLFWRAKIAPTDDFVLSAKRVNRVALGRRLFCFYCFRLQQGRRFDLRLFADRIAVVVVVVDDDNDVVVVVVVVVMMTRRRIYRSQSPQPELFRGMKNRI